MSAVGKLVQKKVPGSLWPPVAALWSPTISELPSLVICRGVPMAPEPVSSRSAGWPSPVGKVFQMSTLPLPVLATANLFPSVHTPHGHWMLPLAGSAFEPPWRMMSAGSALLVGNSVQMRIRSLLVSVTTRRVPSVLALIGQFIWWRPVPGRLVVKLG